MLINNSKTSLLVVIFCSLLLASCGSQKKVSTPQSYRVNLALVENAPSNKYVGLDYGIRLNISDERATDNILKKYDASATNKPYVNVYPDVLSFVTESTRRYMRTMGFNLDSDISTDYMMSLVIREYHISYLSGIGWSATVSMSLEVYDANRQLVYPNVSVVGRSSQNGSPTNFTIATQVINEAHINALKDVDWDKIAYFLRKASKPSQEANKHVQGEGNTSLESTVIRWYLDSAPKGADISLRIVSSTPEVKNTNQNYVGSTPYETTETFDIVGLTYNNSGNVQIEVTCEKAGYITQKKRFNIRQAIDQKEISTKFNLIKEE